MPSQCVFDSRFQVAEAQPLRHRAGVNPFGVEAGAVVRNLNHHPAAAMKRVQPDRGDGRLTGSGAHRGGLDAVVDGVPHHMHQGIGELLDQLAIELGVVAGDHHLRRFVELLRQVAHQANHLVEGRTDRHHAHRHCVALDVAGDATHLRQLSRDLGKRAGATAWFDMSQRIEALVKAEKKLNPNVDFYSASMYYTLGIPIDLYTPIFAVSRMSGWTAHILEQYANNRLIRPRADYTGPDYPQRFIPIEQR